MSFVDQLVKLPYQDTYVETLMITHCQESSDVTDGSHWSERSEINLGNTWRFKI